MKTLPAAFALACLACLAACGGYGSSTSPYGGGNNPGTPVDQNPAPTSANTVNANPALAYNPTSLTVAVGTTVTFNFGSVGHSVTFTTAGAPAEIPVTSNATVTRVFPTAGTFNYHCTVHSNMTGVIVVQ
jgi:plastocyanin